MRRTGTLRSWQDDRGFGFITPAGEGEDLFVHITASPRDGSRPTVGEKLSYELGRGKDGRPQAVHVERHALAGRRSARSQKPKGEWVSAIPGIGGFAVLVLIGVFAYTLYRKPTFEAMPPETAGVMGRAAQAHSFTCDGRIHCSQMTSCAEASFFLRHCPGTQMDGNNDGVPCEKQWCTGFFSR